jgi:hypothetical protein
MAASHFGQCAKLSMFGPRIIKGPTVARLTIEKIACQYAWQLGYDDYPATAECPYDRAKSPRLHSNYWKGWKRAAASSTGAIARQPKGGKRDRSTSNYDGR